MLSVCVTTKTVVILDVPLKRGTISPRAPKGIVNIFAPVRQRSEFFNQNIAGFESFDPRILAPLPLDSEGIDEWLRDRAPVLKVRCSNPAKTCQRSPPC